MSNEIVQRTPASLWIGKRLSFLDLLCLKSFADVGQPVTLFTYEPVENLPDYVHHADAREVFDPPEILRQMAGRRYLIGSPAIHSDIFRIQLLAKTDHFWVDTDAYAVKPLQPVNGYLFAKVRSQVPNGVLSLPKSSQALIRLQSFMSQKGAIPPWWSEEENVEFEKSGQPLDFRYMKWGTLGPAALAHFMHETGEIRHTVRPNVLYPIRSKQKRRFFEPGWIEVSEEVQSIHLYASKLRQVLVDEFDNRPPEGSLLSEMCRKHDIDPLDAQIG